MKKRQKSGDEKRCRQCKTVLPAAAFMDVPKGYRVTICMMCARENVARWKRTNCVGKSVASFKKLER